MSGSSHGASIPEVTHHHTTIDATDLHYVSAGADGTPILLVHGFPETWWAFHRLIPLLAAEHRVIAVDLPGFGDSAAGPEGLTSAATTQILRRLIDELGLGAVHLSGQDIGGPSAYRLAALAPELIRSFTAIETGLPGFGLEALADVTHDGAWYIGMLVAPGIPETLLTGRERTFLGDHLYPAMSARAGAITDDDLDEFTRTYARPHGFAGAGGLYRSMLTDGAEIQALAAARPLPMPALAVGSATGDFTHRTIIQVAAHVDAVTLDGVGHLAALEAPQALAQTLMDFYAGLERR